MTGSSPAAGSLFVGVDRAVFVAALIDRLRQGGLPVAGGDAATIARGLRVVDPATVGELYWLCRVAVVRRHHDITRFNQHFASVFDVEGELPGGRPLSVVTGSTSTGTDQGAGHQAIRTLTDGDAVHGAGLPWLNRTPSIDPFGGDQPDDTDDTTTLAEPQPSADELLATTPFDLLDPTQLEELGRRIEHAITHWPTRPTRRTRPSPRGRVDLRRTMALARRTGGEPLVITRRDLSRRPRPVVAILDVSGSMQPSARAYLHLMRTLATVGQAEVFAFATKLARLTPALRMRSVDQALSRAEELVDDRFGGTRIASSFAQLLRHPAWGAGLRGAVIIVVSDGWDTDDPRELGRRTAQLARRSHRLIWVNPRLAAAGFQPQVAGMAAALAHCDDFLPGNTLDAMGEVLDALGQ